MNKQWHSQSAIPLETDKPFAADVLCRRAGQSQATRMMRRRWVATGDQESADSHSVLVCRRTWTRTASVVNGSSALRCLLQSQSQASADS